MKNILGIRKEDKNKWERRVPLTPENIKVLKETYNIETIVQPFMERAFNDKDFENHGAIIKNDLSDCSTIIAVKEVPQHLIIPNKKYLFFSHTIKGQSYNMPLLKTIMDKKCTLIDYECIRNSDGRRLVFFGRFAGIAGMIDTLFSIGQRYKSLGIVSTFLKIKASYQYGILKDAVEHISAISKEIQQNGLPKELTPLVIGFTGYGNVSKGAQEIFDLLPHVQITPKELLTTELNNDKIYKVVFKEEDIVDNIDQSQQFELQDYFNYPSKYKSIFYKYLNKLDVLINAIYWDKPFPKLIEKKYLKENLDTVKLKITTDISCDFNGSIEYTQKVMEPDLPAYVYNPRNETITDGYEGEGIVNIAVDNLPTELPMDASKSFSKKLFPFIENLVKTETNVPFDDSSFIEELKNAVIVYNGELTPNFKYLEKYM